MITQNANIYPPGISKNLQKYPVQNTYHQPPIMEYKWKEYLRCHHSLINRWEVLWCLVCWLQLILFLLSMSLPQGSEQDSMGQWILRWHYKSMTMVRGDYPNAWFMPGTRLSMMATVQARHSTMTSLSGGKRGMTSTAGWPGRRAFVRYAAIPFSIKSDRKVNNPVSTRRPPWVR